MDDTDRRDLYPGRVRIQRMEHVGELEQYENSYRLCYVRGPEGIIIELAAQIK